MIGASVVVLAAFVGMTRQQTGVGDARFLRSMIPHHSGAILVCREAELRDPELRALCASIVEGQQSEIEIMERELRAGTP